MTVNEETLPGTERRQWDRGAIHVAERYRLRRQERSRDGSALGRNPVAVERIKRLDRMEEAGLIERRPDPNDRRGTLVRLTRRGENLIDRAVETHVSNEERLLSVLLRPSAAHSTAC